jgi:orotidine-5'-phosphate decarboxylase
MKKSAFFLFLLFCIVMQRPLTANAVIRALDSRMEKADSLVCVGLDPDMAKLPFEILRSEGSDEAKVFDFLSEVVEITAPHVCAYKIQKAFFDQFAGGHELLRKIIDYIHMSYPSIPVFVDCKIGDTENTMAVYKKILFDEMKADGIVVNPYMGDDVMDLFVKNPNTVGIVLVQTSNPSARIVQDLKLENGKLLWEQMLGLVVTRWNTQKNLIPVLSSHSPLGEYAAIREHLPQEMPILLAGVGQQGGDPKVMQQLLNRDRRGVFVNSSRGILYPYAQNDTAWREAVLRAVIELKGTLNTLRSEEQE